MPAWRALRDRHTTRLILQPPARRTLLAVTVLEEGLLRPNAQANLQGRPIMWPRSGHPQERPLSGAPTVRPQARQSRD
jgi:hypothetical protein